MVLEWTEFLRCPRHCDKNLTRNRALPRRGRTPGPKGGASGEDLNAATEMNKWCRLLYGNYGSMLVSLRDMTIARDGRRTDRSTSATSHISPYRRANYKRNSVNRNGTSATPTRGTSMQTFQCLPSQATMWSPYHVQPTQTSLHYPVCIAYFQAVLSLC